jgi:hypothetical protein
MHATPTSAEGGPIMINHSLHRSMHHLYPTIAYVAIAMVSAAPTQAQGETQCTVDTPDAWYPLRGVSSFSASVTQSYAGTNPCLGGWPPCSGFCHSEVSGLVGKVRNSYCRVWVPVGDPASPHYPGYWCEPRISEPLNWYGTEPGAAEQGGVVNLFGEFDGYATSGSVNISFSQPVCAWFFTGWVSGGRVLNEFGFDRLYVHAGETVALQSQASRAALYYSTCPDTDSNGICDEYDTAARAFGDFNSSGSIDGVDLATLLAAWGSTGGLCDINRDGVVDANDLTFLLSRWGQGA